MGTQKKNTEKMIKCPGCELMLPETDIQAQVQHMETQHSHIITTRHKVAGIRSEYTHPSQIRRR